MRPYRTGGRSCARLGTVAALLLLPLNACKLNTDNILDVTNPDIIDPGSLANPNAAPALRVGTLGRLDLATAGGSGAESIFILGGTLADEFRSSDTFSQRNEIDQRLTQNSNANLDAAYRALHRARISAMQTIESYNTYVKTPSGDAIGEMYLVQAVTEVLFGENFCSGVPFSKLDLAGNETIGAQLTTEQTLQLAAAHADSAINSAKTVTTTLSTSVQNAAAVIKGRALLDLGQYAAAAAAVASVPTSFRYNLEHAQTTRDNQVWSWNINQRRFSVANGEGTNGIDFAGSKDPRLGTIGFSAKGGFDATTDLYTQGVYNARDASFPLATGIEARLIEAEAALQAGNNTLFLQKLNDPRSTAQTIGNVTLAANQLPPLTDPGTTAGRVDLLFRERAMWLFASGHRLGDLRRLIRQYNRAENTVFPTGIWFKTGSPYGSDVNLPIPQSEQNISADFKGCLDRKA